jgi:hypothetical protein
MVAMHLRCAIPPGSTARDAFAAKRGIHPFPSIRAHVVEPMSNRTQLAQLRTLATGRPSHALEAKEAA